MKKLGLKTPFEALNLNILIIIYIFGVNVRYKIQNDIFSLPKIDHFKRSQLEIIYMGLLFAICKAGEIIISNFKIHFFL